MYKVYPDQDSNLELLFRKRNKDFTIKLPGCDVAIKIAFLSVIKVPDTDHAQHKNVQQQ